MKLPTLLACMMLQSMLMPALLHAASSERVVTGTVIANRSVTLATRIMGRITQVHATEGDQLTTGQVIVEIDDTEYRAQLKSSEASQDRAKAELAHRKRISKRLQQLAKTNVASQDVIDEATYHLEVAEANLKVAQAQIEAIRSTLAETRIKAPFDSVVIKKYAETGLVTQPGQPLYEVQDQSQLKFRARVKERDLAHINLNDKALITITSLGDEPVSAIVTRIIPNGDARHTFIIELALPPQSDLYPGMFGKMVFQ